MKTKPKTTWSDVREAVCALRATLDAVQEAFAARKRREAMPDPLREFMGL